MPIQVQGPTGQLYEFPDGTSDATMEAADVMAYQLAQLLTTDADAPCNEGDRNAEATR